MKTAKTKTKPWSKDFPRNPGWYWKAFLMESGSWYVHATCLDAEDMRHRTVAPKPWERWIPLRAPAPPKTKEKKMKKAVKARRKKLLTA